MVLTLDHPVFQPLLGLLGPLFRLLLVFGWRLRGRRRRLLTRVWLLLVQQDDVFGYRGRLQVEIGVVGRHRHIRHLRRSRIDIRRGYVREYRAAGYRGLCWETLARWLGRQVGLVLAPVGVVDPFVKLLVLKPDIFDARLFACLDGLGASNSQRQSERIKALGPDLFLQLRTLFHEGMFFGRHASLSHNDSVLFWRHTAVLRHQSGRSMSALRAISVTVSAVVTSPAVTLGRASSTSSMTCSIFASVKSRKLPWGSVRGA